MTLLDTDAPTEAFQRAMHRTLTSQDDYLRRIHWWVRLFGLVWIVLPVIVGLAAILALAMAAALNQ